MGFHQSGRNSGVIHAGVYYVPGSAKARLCHAGRASMIEYCRDNGIDHVVCGKLVVATTPSSGSAWWSWSVAPANGVRAELLAPAALREREPHVAGVAALHVLDTGIVDYAAVCRSLAAEIHGAGRHDPPRVRGRVGGGPTDGARGRDDADPIEAQRVVTCAACTPTRWRRR